MSPSNQNQMYPTVDDPFFIHQLDSPTTNLVSPMLSDDNFGTWICAMTMALRAKNKLGFVDGTIEKPKQRLSSSDELRQWKRCNDLVGSWIINSVSPDIPKSILNTDSAREMWDDLHKRFSQTNRPGLKIFQVKQSIASFKQAEGDSVSVYYTKLKSLWNELNYLRQVQVEDLDLEQDRAMEFLLGLHDRFANVRTRILFTDPLPTISKMYSIVREEEECQRASIVTATTSKNNMSSRKMHNPVEESARVALFGAFIGIIGMLVGIGVPKRK